MILSAQNPKVKLVKGLLNRRKERQKSGLFVVEGVRLLEEAIACEWEPELIFYNKDLSSRGMHLLDQLVEMHAEKVFEIDTSVMRSISDTETPQGILAVFRKKMLSTPDTIDFGLMLDNLRDPGNLGTVLRTALAAGVQAVFLLQGTTDAFAPKVVRAGMGAHFRLPIIETSWQDVWHRYHDGPVAAKFYLADIEGKHTCWEVDLKCPAILVIGGEAEGGSTETRNEVDETVVIPMPGNSESLNAAVAAGVFMFEVVRQRSL